VSAQRLKYEGCAYQTGNENGAVAGRIAFTSNLIEFEHADGVFELPLERLDPELAAAGGAIFHDTATDWHIESPDERVWDDYFLQRNPQLRRRIRDLRARHEGGRTLKYALYFLALFGVIFIVTWALVATATRFAINQTPVAWEEHLTDSVIAEHTNLFVIDTNDVHLSVVTQLVERIAAALPPAERRYQFRVAVLDHHIVNAFAMPGGRIFVFKGLLYNVQQPEELAGVLAHEMAHVTHRHGLHKLIAAKGPYYALRLFIGKQEGLLSDISSASQLLVGLQYSRSMERDADATGWHYLEAADIDPRGMANFFRHQEPRANEDYIPELFRTHPATGERIAALDKLWADSPHPTNFVTLPVATNADWLDDDQLERMSRELRR
jgi:beta-barrel assembly-enhancing protease